MAFVKFKRNWFGPDGKRYRAMDGLHEIHDDLILAQVPSDAEVYDGQNMPTLTPRPKPGFGAKPTNELIADLVPGAAPVRVLAPNRNGPRVDPNAPGEKDRVAKAAAAQQAMAGIDPKSGLEDREERMKETQASINKMLPLAAEIAEDIEQAEDPVAAAAAEVQPPAPKPGPKTDKK